jgi:hypothetical protein
MKVFDSSAVPALIFGQPGAALVARLMDHRRWPEQQPHRGPNAGGAAFSAAAGARGLAGADGTG